MVFFSEILDVFVVFENDDFILTLKWKFDELKKFSQCGLMLRIDERNWLKTSIMNDTVAQNGNEIYVGNKAGIPLGFNEVTKSY